MPTAPSTNPEGSAKLGSPVRPRRRSPSTDDAAETLASLVSATTASAKGGMIIKVEAAARNSSETRQSFTNPSTVVNGAAAKGTNGCVMSSSSSKAASGSSQSLPSSMKASSSRSSSRSPNETTATSSTSSLTTNATPKAASLEGSPGRKGKLQPRTTSSPVGGAIGRHRTLARISMADIEKESDVLRPSSPVSMPTEKDNKALPSWVTAQPIQLRPKYVSTPDLRTPQLPMPMIMPRPLPVPMPVPMPMPMSMPMPMPISMPIPMHTPISTLAPGVNAGAPRYQALSVVGQSQAPTVKMGAKGTTGTDGAAGAAKPGPSSIGLQAPKTPLPVHEAPSLSSGVSISMPRYAGLKPTPLNVTTTKASISATPKLLPNAFTSLPGVPTSLPSALTFLPGEPRGEAALGTMDERIAFVRAAAMQQQQIPLKQKVPKYTQPLQDIPTVAPSSVVTTTICQGKKLHIPKVHVTQYMKNNELYLNKPDSFDQKFFETYDARSLSGFVVTKKSMAEQKSAVQQRIRPIAKVTRLRTEKVCIVQSAECVMMPTRLQHGFVSRKPVACEHCKRVTCALRRLYEREEGKIKDRLERTQRKLSELRVRYDVVLKENARLQKKVNAGDTKLRKKVTEQRNRIGMLKTRNRSLSKRLQTSHAGHARAERSSKRKRQGDQREKARSTGPPGPTGEEEGEEEYWEEMMERLVSLNAAKKSELPCTKKARVSGDDVTTGRKTKKKDYFCLVSETSKDDDDDGDDGDDDDDDGDDGDDDDDDDDDGDEGDDGDNGFGRDVYPGKPTMDSRGQESPDLASVGSDDVDIGAAGCSDSDLDSGTEDPSSSEEVGDDQ